MGAMPMTRWIHCKWLYCKQVRKRKKKSQALTSDTFLLVNINLFYRTGWIQAKCAMTEISREQEPENLSELTRIICVGATK